MPAMGRGGKGKKKEEPAEEVPKDFTKLFGPDGKTPLWFVLRSAALKGNVDVIKACIKMGEEKWDAVKNEKLDGRRRTVLHIAADKGHAELVQVLLDNGCEVDKLRQPEGITPMFTACHKGHFAVVKLLNTHWQKYCDKHDLPKDVRNALFVDPKKDTGATPLWIACQEGHLKIVEYLLEMGARPDVRRTIGSETPLWIASQNGHGAIVKVLLEAGADPNMVRKWDGSSPVYKAAEHGELRSMRELIAHGADVNLCRSDSGAGPLHVAAFKGFKEAVHMLLEAGANPAAVMEAPAQEGRTPLEIATFRGHAEVKELLIAAGAQMQTEIPVGSKAV